MDKKVDTEKIEQRWKPGRLAGALMRDREAQQARVRKYVLRQNANARRRLVK